MGGVRPQEHAGGLEERGGGRTVRSPSGPRRDAQQVSIKHYVINMNVHFKICKLTIRVSSLMYWNVKQKLKRILRRKMKRLDDEVIEVDSLSPTPMDWAMMHFWYILTK